MAGSTCKHKRFSLCRRNMPTLLLLLLLLLFLAACSTTAPLRETEVAQSRVELGGIVADSEGLFGARPAIPDPADLHALSPEQLSRFRAYLDNPLRNHVPLHQRVFDYLEDITVRFAYYGRTLPAAEALEQQSGNCMSLAVLTTALARAAGIEMDYQLMEDVPVFEYQGSIVFKGVHLRTILYQDGWTPPKIESVFARRPGLQVDYFPSSRARFVANVDVENYLAMYYQNVAVELLERGDLSGAYWYALEALDFDPLHVPAISTLAVVHRRAGAPAQAERLYRYGLAHSENSLGLLRNYHALLSYQGRDEEAGELARQLQNLDDPGPYSWLRLAQAAELEQDYDSALRYYAKALERAPYMHEVELSMALANYRAGRPRQAERALRDAISHVQIPATRRLYQAKLELLSKELYN